MSFTEIKDNVMDVVYFIGGMLSYLMIGTMTVGVIYGIISWFV